MGLIDWSDTYDGYWFELAEIKIRRPLWPRYCVHTGQWLWLKPCVRGETSYYMRSGTKRYDIRWISQEKLIEQKLKYKGR
jgi:hypothetical protein